MPRFSSLSYVPAETRSTLRDRLTRYLPAHHGASSHGAKGVMLNDEAMLHFLQHLTIEFENDLERARATYKAALAENWRTWLR